MRKRRTFNPKVGKLSFYDVSKKQGIKGTNSLAFRKKATLALKSAGYQNSQIKDILVGKKKMEHTTLKRVFKKLNEAKVIKKGASAVTNYVAADKRHQRLIRSRHLYDFQESIMAEKELEKTQEILRLKKENEKKNGNNQEVEYHNLSQPVRTAISQQNNMTNHNSGVKDLPID